MRILFSLFVILFITSCGFHQGSMVSNASLGNNDFEILELVSAKSYTKRYFGLGGLKQKALVLDTKKKLYNNHPLKKNQAFANISVDFHNTTVFFVNKVTCTISADIVQFGEKETDSLHTGFKKLNELKELKKVVADKDNLNYIIGQSVFFKSGNVVGKGKVKSVASQINLIQVVANEESYNLNPSFVFYELEDENLPASLKEYNAQQKVEFLAEDIKKEGNLVGANEKFLVIKSKGEFFIRTPSEIKF